MIAETAAGARTTIWKILRVYALMMTITFAELYLGFVLLKIPMPLLLAFLVAVVDILPVLGTGTVLIPWALILCIIGKTGLGVCSITCADYAPAKRSPSSSSPKRRSCLPAPP